MSADTLEAIRRARSSFLKCRSYAQGLVAGVQIDDPKAPQPARDSVFGAWYFEAAQGPLGRLASFQAIEPAFTSLIDHYAAMHDWVRQGRADRAQTRLESVMEDCRQLLELLDLLEREVQQTMQAQQ